MLYSLANLVISAALAFIGLLAAVLLLVALLRVCRRPLVKLPASAIVVLSIFAVISEGVANKMRCGTERQILEN